MINKNLWDEQKIVLRGKLIAIDVYIKKKNSNQPPNFTP